MSTHSDHAKDRLDALDIVERIERGEIEVVPGRTAAAIQRLIDRDVERDREDGVPLGTARSSAEAQFGRVDTPVLERFSIERKASGVTEHLKFQEWARLTIQNGDEAARIARTMLDTNEPYAYNDADPEFYEVFEVLDREALSAQLAAADPEAGVQALDAEVAAEQEFDRERRDSR